MGRRRRASTLLVLVHQLRTQGTLMILAPPHRMLMGMLGHPPLRF
uniref:Uncharacterized protein n=1 Tax=Arundo donax TaxID=35708 RepID=A0A0A9PAZ0_ARUDO